MQNTNNPFGAKVLKRIWPAELIVGVVFLTAVMFVSEKSDISSTENELLNTVDYIKEQYSNYNSLDLASETKSLMRMVESAEYIDREISCNTQTERGSAVPSEEELKACAEHSYVTGIVLLDKDGGIVNFVSTEDSILPKEISDAAANDELLGTESFDAGTYTCRVQMEDGSYSDIAAVGRSDGHGIVMAYYHTPLIYTEKFSNSPEMLLSGYNTEHNGTLVISHGSTIAASNNQELIGKDINDVPILKHIKERAAGRKLVHTRNDPGDHSRTFGIMEKGRDFYVYGYLPERSVFGTTPRNMLYALIIYGAALAVINIARWKVTQDYKEVQLRIKESYAENLERKNDELKAAVDRADRANLAKTNFLSRMSHDIRTPLNGIIGLLKIDEAHPDDTELLNKNREKMQVSANHLLDLINDILQMSKLEDGEVVLAREVISLKQLSSEIVTIVRQRAADAGVTLVYASDDVETDFDGRQGAFIEPYVFGSPLHLRQLFLNIYSNCIKYNRVGGKVLTKVSCLGTERNTVTYEWTISDTGVGMSAEFLEHIFDPFSQERDDARSTYNGTGLGMAIVKSLVTKMNGMIEVTSEVDKGSKFVITLPFEISDHAPANANADAESDADIRGVRLLLAEDNELNAEIAETLLKDEGAQVTRVHNGRQAVDIFASSPEGRFDVILMDIMMPEMDGCTAARAIRAIDRKDAERIPIIAMTANAFAEDAQKCFDAGMNAHLAKPLQMQTVTATIARFYKRDVKAGRNRILR